MLILMLKKNRTFFFYLTCAQETAIQWSEGPKQNVVVTCGQTQFCLYLSVLTLLHSERPKLYAILAFLSAIGLSNNIGLKEMATPSPSAGIIQLF